MTLGNGATQSGGNTGWAPPKGLVWYTDGSRNGDRGGAGIWSEGPSIARALRLGSHMSVLQAELAALRACAREVLDGEDRGKKIYICSDSKRALRALLRHESSSRLVNECTELVERVSVNSQLDVDRIPDHAGILGNVRADELAKKGCLKTAPTREDLVGMHVDMVKDMIRKRAERGILEKWRSEKGAKHTRTLLREPTKKLAGTLVGQNRIKLRSLVGLITGHWPLASYLAKIDRGIDPNCPKCGLTEENRHHLDTKYSGFDQVRWNVFRATCAKELHVDTDGIEGLYEFARRANLLTPMD
ncbi:uncharacterized protein [Fopius arisanus]|uniref:RNase H type-1 domain-containing protein n=1 Tax=Fopius arisanus TaxID=64838 RepID=A0A9R1T123_9HYME|nr:PREDICTED: uncharacterized protein LOC105265145 [Fopius arisanus]